MQFFNVKNWENLQHYKDRAPPWIKLYNHLLDDYEFACLQDASKLHLLLIWLLASRNNNRLPYNPRWIKQRIGVDSDVDLNELLSLGFIEVEPSEDGVSRLLEHNASTPLAESKQVATTEKSREEGEREAEEEKSRKRGKPLDYSSWPQLPSDDILKSWLAHRVRMKAKVTQTVVTRLAKELEQAVAMGWTVDDCLAESETRAWKSFKAEWVTPKAGLPQAGDLQREQELQEWANGGDMFNGQVIDHE